MPALVSLEMGLRIMEIEPDHIAAFYTPLLAELHRAAPKAKLQLHSNVRVEARHFEPQWQLVRQCIDNFFELLKVIGEPSEENPVQALRLAINVYLPLEVSVFCWVWIVFRGN